MDILSLITTIFATIVGATSLTLFNTFFSKKKIATDEQEVKDDVQKVISNIITIKQEEKIDDVLTLMIKNVGELREYYVINKQQARNSFSAALFISFLGFILFAAGVLMTYVYKAETVIQYSTIGGAIVEIIAGLFFWLYSKAITQINLFHSSLLKTEKFLTAIQLTEKISTEHRDGMYSFIISRIISNDFANELNTIELPKIDGQVNKKESKPSPEAK